MSANGRGYDDALKQIEKAKTHENWAFLNFYNLNELPDELQTIDAIGISLSLREIESIDFGLLAKLRNLRNLSMTLCDNISVEGVSELTSLKTLSVRYSALTSSDFAKCQICTQLL